MALNEFLELVTSQAFRKRTSNRFDCDIVEEVLPNPTNGGLAYCRQAE